MPVFKVSSYVLEHFSVSYQKKDGKIEIRDGEKRGREREEEGKKETKGNEVIDTKLVAQLWR